MQYPIKAKDDVFIIWKELGETPLQALERLREQEGIDPDVPMTYAGRLDPLAEGQLLILVGEECKNKEKYLGLDKEYEVEILLGASTDTGDVMGKIVDSQKFVVDSNLDDVLLPVLQRLIGEVSWPYPAFSSKTVDGKPLFLWSLEGKINEVEIPKRVSEIYELELLSPSSIELGVSKLREVVHKKINSIKPVPANIESKRLGADFRREDVLKNWNNLLKQHVARGPLATCGQEFKIVKVRCKCSSGTYMRTLAQKIGEELGVPALALSIVRTKIML